MEVGIGRIDCNMTWASHNKDSVKVIDQHWVDLSSFEMGPNRGPIVMSARMDAPTKRIADAMSSLQWRRHAVNMLLHCCLIEESDRELGIGDWYQQGRGGKSMALYATISH
eukprot:scaffold9586_cov109-Cylindrotheca_fusiformis.AAC.2